MLNARTRKAIYALSAVVIPLLIVVGVDQHDAAVYVAAAVGVANVALAFFNVPGDES